jgi:hypothetical protein
MKTKIILYSIIAFLGLAMVFAFKSVNDKSSGKDLIIVRVIQSPSGMTGTLDPKILIISNDVKEIPLQKDKDKNVSQNATLILETLKDLCDKNYHIVTSSSISSVSTSITDYIFEKE